MTFLFVEEFARFAFDYLSATTGKVQVDAIGLRGMAFNPNDVPPGVSLVNLELILKDPKAIESLFCWCLVVYEGEVGRKRLTAGMIEPFERFVRQAHSKMFTIDMCLIKTEDQGYEVCGIGDALDKYLMTWAEILEDQGAQFEIVIWAAHEYFDDEL